MWTSGSQSSMPACGEGGGHEVAHGVADAGGDDVVAGVVGAGGADHRVDVVGRPAPVAAGVEVAEHEPVGPALGDRGDGGGDLAGHELRAAAAGDSWL